MKVIMMHYDALVHIYANFNYLYQIALSDPVLLQEKN